MVDPTISTDNSGRIAWANKISQVLSTGSHIYVEILNYHKIVSPTGLRLRSLQYEMRSIS